MLQGTLTMDGMVFIATTNHLEILDPAFYREGRFDVLLELSACDREQIRAAFKRFFSREPCPVALDKIKDGQHIPAAIVSRFAKCLCAVEQDDAVILTFDGM
jgi:SpoVK/Ycf46/Vps4 family AAA+-type ATPase